MQKYVSKEVVCPFYHKEEPFKLLCEGFCKTTTLQITFRSRDNLLLHKDCFCNEMDGYIKCPIYSVIIKQYED
jgi:hypothetical protein